MRIVSLLPSTTEILFALGADDDVVGVTFECDYPPEARQRRIVSTSNLPDGLPPEQIDRVVSERMAAGEDLYRLDRGALAGLDADLVVTQDLCAVCAVDVSDVHDALEYLACRADVLTIDPHNLDEVLESIRTLGKATGTEPEAEELITGLRARLDVVRDRVAGCRPVPTLVLEWTDPPFAPGHWVPDMVSVAGGANVLGTVGAKSFRTTWDDVARTAPDVVVGAPCGFGLEQSARLGRELLERDVLPDVALWAVDANASFARPGPRLVDGVEALAAILHPDTFGSPSSNLAVRLA